MLFSHALSIRRKRHCVVYALVQWQRHNVFSRVFICCIKVQKICLEIRRTTIAERYLFDLVVVGCLIDLVGLNPSTWNDRSCIFSQMMLKYFEPGKNSCTPTCVIWPYANHCHTRHCFSQAQETLMFHHWCPTGQNRFMIHTYSVMY